MAASKKMSGDAHARGEERWGREQSLIIDCGGETQKTRTGSLSSEETLLA